jgi:hypothetical protein
MPLQYIGKVKNTALDANGNPVTDASLAASTDALTTRINSQITSPLDLTDPSNAQAAVDEILASRVKADPVTLPTRDAKTTSQSYNDAVYGGNHVSFSDAGQPVLDAFNNNSSIDPNVAFDPTAVVDSIAQLQSQKVNLDSRAITQAILDKKKSLDSANKEIDKANRDLIAFAGGGTDIGSVATRLNLESLFGDSSATRQEQARKIIEKDTDAAQADYNSASAKNAAIDKKLTALSKAYNNRSEAKTTDALSKYVNDSSIDETDGDLKQGRDAIDEALFNILTKGSDPKAQIAALENTDLSKVSKEYFKTKLQDILGKDYLPPDFSRMTSEERQRWKNFIVIEASKLEANKPTTDTSKGN